jgi:hypothetical protein
MEIDTIIYKAKDGRTFTDPLKCEEYEKNLGVIPGSIGELIKILEKYSPEHQVCLLVMWWDKEKKKIQMEPLLSVKIADDDDAMAFEKDRIIKVKSALKYLRKLPQDEQAQWMGWVTESFAADMCTVMANTNPRLFDTINNNKD